MFENATNARIGEITKDWFKYARDRDAIRDTAKNLTRQSFCCVFISITVV